MTSKLSRLAGIIASLHEGATPSDPRDDNNNGNGHKYSNNNSSCESLNADDALLKPIKSETALKLNDDPPTLQAQFAQSQLHQAQSTAVVDETAITLCSMCGTAVSNRANLMVHMRRHAGYKPFSCSRCAYAGYDDEDVKAHVEKWVTVDGYGMLILTFQITHIRSECHCQIQRDPEVGIRY